MSAKKLATPINEQDHVTGAPTASVSLVAYVDYECPYSAQFFSDLEAVKMHLGSQVRIALRHFPLDKHTHAMAAAEAAEAAAEHGRFWEMSALLFEHQKSLDRDTLMRLAHELRLELVKFTDAIDRGAHAEKIKAQKKTGEKSAVKQTPTIFINGVKHEGARDLRSLIGALEEAGRKAPRTYADLEEHPFIGA